MREWNEFDKFKTILKKYMPEKGEGETMASQIATAVNKLVYKWYNDGDVFDNSGQLLGWANDLSSYANWLYKYVPEVEPVFCAYDNSKAVIVDEDYEELLMDFCEICLEEKLLKKYNVPKVGSIYECTGKYEFIDDEDEIW